MVHLKISSDSSLGRRPTSKSDEFFKCTILVIELQWCENIDFYQKWCSYWRRDPQSENCYVSFRMRANYRGVSEQFDICMFMFG